MRPCRAEREVNLPSGEAGLWVLILGDMLVFLLLFAAYMQARSKAPALFDAAQQSLNKGLGSLNTVFLLCSSLMVVIAVLGIRAASHGIASAACLSAFAFGLCFMIVKVGEWWHHAVADTARGSDQFWLYYYIITGLHFGHLCIGLVLLIVMFFQVRTADGSSRRFALVEGMGCFWHMVDLLWMVIFALLYLVK